jgi:hypothetical protein
MTVESMWAENQFSIQQNVASNMADRERPTSGQKMKSIRTQACKFDKDKYKDTGIRSNYMINDGYNMEVSVMMFDIICAITGVVNFNNAIRAISVIRNFPEQPKPIKHQIAPEQPEPIVEYNNPKPHFKIECGVCKDVKDIRYDFYKNRKLICKSCYISRQIQRRKNK